MSAHWYYVGVEPCGCWTMAMVDMTEDPARWNMTAAQAAKEMGEEIAMFEKESPDCAIEHVHVDRMEVGKQLAAPWPESCPHLGVFPTLEEAAAARRNAEEELFGKHGYHASQRSDSL